MAPDNLKVGDIFIDEGYKYKVTAVRTDGCGRYDTEFVGYAKQAEKEPVKEEVEEKPTEEEKTVYIARFLYSGQDIEKLI